jgi:hypothetical protein
MNSFTYIIRSDDKYSGNHYNCQIRLDGLPTKYKTFLVEPIGFYSDSGMDAYLEVFSEDIPFLNGYDTKNKSLKILYSNALLNNSTMIYKVSNFNGRYINFHILNNSNGFVNTVGDWKLYLKFTGIEE